MFTYFHLHFLAPSLPSLSVPCLNTALVPPICVSPPSPPSHPPLLLLFLRKALFSLIGLHLFPLPSHSARWWRALSLSLSLFDSLSLYLCHSPLSVCLLICLPLCLHRYLPPFFLPLILIPISSRTLDSFNTFKEASIMLPCGGNISLFIFHHPWQYFFRPALSGCLFFPNSYTLLWIQS